jgi:hypothetical protein
VLDRVEAYVNDVEARNAANESGSLRVSTDALSPAHFRYFAVREQIQRIDRLLRQIDQSSNRPSLVTRRTPRVRTPRRVCTPGDAAEEYRAMLTHADARGLIGPMLERARPFGDEPVDQLSELLDECALLEAVQADASDRVLLSLRPLGGREHEMIRQLSEGYAHLFNRQHGFVATALDAPDPGCAWLLLEMPGAAAVFRGEAGTHLFYPAHENVLPVEVTTRTLSPDDDPDAIARKLTRDREDWRAQVAAGSVSADSGPYRLGPIVRVYDPGVGTLDLRSVLLCANLPTAAELRRFILAGLPLPEQLLTASS